MAILSTILVCQGQESFYAFTDYQYQVWFMAYQPFSGYSMLNYLFTIKVKLHFEQYNKGGLHNITVSTDLESVLHTDYN